MDTCPSETGTIDCVVSDEVPDCNEATYTRYNSTAYLGRYCIPVKDELPVSLALQYDSVLDNAGTGWAAEWAGDIIDSWFAIMVSILFSLILSFIIMLVVNKCTKIIFWLGVVATIVLIICIGIGLFIYSGQFEGWGRRGLRIAAIVVWCLIAAFLIVVCCLWWELRVAIAIIECAAAFVNATKRIIVIPVVNFWIVISFLFLWVLTGIFLWSAGDIEANGGFQTKSVKWNNYTRACWVY